MDNSEHNTNSESNSEFDGNDFLNQFETELYTHELEALNALAVNKSGIISSFCGTGKSRIITEFVIKEFEQSDATEHVIIFFPSLLLLGEFFEKYIEEHQFNALLICSESKDKFSEEWFKEEETLTLITYESINKIAKYINYFTTALFDEAHHVCTKNRIKILQNLNAKCFYFTATPRETKFLDMFNADAPDQVDQDFDFSTGGIIFEYNFTDALKDTVVCDYELIFRLYEDVNPEEHKELKQLHAIFNLAKENNRKRIIIFNEYIKAEKLNKTNCESFKFNDQSIQIISGETHKEKRAEIFEWFQDDSEQIKIICNVSCVKEGVDLPCTDMIIFCDEKQSKTEIIEAVGRGTRKHANKQDCLVVALIDYENSVEELTHFENINIKGKFKVVEYICKALKEVDLRIEEIMQGKASSLKFSIETDNESNIVNIKDSGYIDEIRVELNLYTDSDQKWLQKLDECKEFKQEFKKYPSNSSKDLTEKRLGEWLSNEKNGLKGKKYKLTVERTVELEEYLTEFEDNDEIWGETLDGCKEFKQEFNKYPSEHSKDPTEKRFGTWLSHEKNILKGKGYKLTAERKIELEEYLSEFEGNDEIWVETLDECKEFKQEFNKYPSNSSKDLAEKRLGEWLSQEKNGLKGKGYKLTTERKAELEEYLTDFEDNDEIWVETLDECKEFKQEFNKYPNKRSKDLAEKRLGEWLSGEKTALKGKRSCKLTMVERKALLEEYLADFKNKDEQRLKKIATKTIAGKEDSNIDVQTVKHINREKEERIKPLLSALHEKYKTLNSQNLHTLFKQKPALWKEYHELVEINEEGFSDEENLAYKRIIKYLEAMKFKRPKLVVDLGCGLNRLKQEMQHDFRFEFMSFDHVAVDESVQECDISKLPVEDDFANICILCLSLWGSNCVEYLYESYRILEQGGILLIIEPTKRWLQTLPEQNETDLEENRLIQECETVGFKVKVLSEDKFVFLELTKKYTAPI